MICPIKKSGGNDYDYVSGTIAEYCAEVDKDGVKYYEHHVDLTDADHDFTKDIDVLCYNKEEGKKVTCGYIADIVFEKDEPEVQEDKSGWIIGNAAAGYWSSVEYIKGKGWIMKDTTDGGAQGQFWSIIPNAVIQKKISEGYTKMTIVYANSFEGVDNPNVGDFIKTKSMICPIKKSGGNDYDYVSGTIAEYCAEVDKDGVKYYEHHVDLTDADHDFTKDIDVLCCNKEESKKVTCGYVADIVFEKGEPVVQEDKSGWMLGSAGDNGAVRYIEGKGWVMSPVSGSGDFWCLISGSVIQQKIAEGYTKMTIVYANNLEGSENKDTGNFVNTMSRLYPCKAGGGYISDYVSGAISSYCVINAAGNYEHTISLTDENIDFTKDQYVYCVAADNNNGNAVTRGYIADIVFSK